jgi:hypothetical protein
VRVPRLPKEPRGEPAQPGKDDFPHNKSQVVLPLQDSPGKAILGSSIGAALKNPRRIIAWRPRKMFKIGNQWFAGGLWVLSD